MVEKVFHATSKCAILVCNVIAHVIAKATLTSL